MNRRRTGILAGVGVTAVAVIGAAIAIPTLVERRLAGWVDRAAESMVDVDVSLGSVEISVLSTFPRAQVELSDVVVAGRGGFEGVELARLPRVELGIDLLSALSSSGVTIQQLTAEGGRIHIVYDADGAANWDVLPDSEGDASADSHLRLSRVDLRDLEVLYEDRASWLRTDIQGIDVVGTADLTQNLAKVESSGTIASLTMFYAGVTWLEATRWSSRMAVDYDQLTGEIRFGENDVTINALPLKFSGSVAPVGEDWDIDVVYEATDTSFAALLSLVPQAYGDQFADVDASGTVSLGGTAKGRYDSDSEDLPGFTMDMSVADGRFHFPGAPVPVDQVAAKLSIEHPQGPMDTTVVRAEHFALTAAGSGFRGRFRLATPDSDPDLDVMMEGQVDLGALGQALPRGTEVPSVDGKLDVDFTLKGRMSAFEGQKLESIKASGTVRGRDLRGSFDGEPVEVDRLDLQLDPQRFTLNQLDARAMGSDVRLSGTVDDALPWMLTDTAVLGGRLALSSKRLDLRPLQGDDTEDGDQLLVAIPASLDLTVDLDVETLRTKDLSVEQVTGQMGVRDGIARLEGVDGRMLGGRVALSGTYAAPTAERADLDLRVRGNRLVVGDVLRTFETLELIAPVLKQADGRFDGDFSLVAQLKKDGSPDLSAVTSAGDLIPIAMSLRSGPTDALLGKLGADAEALALAGSRVAYAFQNGTVDVRPFTAKLGKQDATIHGSFGPLDRSLDLAIDVPMDTKLLKQTGLLGSLSGTVPKTVDVRATIGGTYDKPKLKVGLSGGVAEELVDAALDPLVAAATAQGDKLLAEARDAADKLLREAEKGAAALVDKARDEARKLRREAKGKPLVEMAAKSAADLIKKKGDEAADKLTREAEKGADKLVNQAQRERDALIEDARRKAANAAGGR